MRVVEWEGRYRLCRNSRFNWKFSKSAKIFSGFNFFPPPFSKKQRMPVYRASFNNFNFICRLRMEVAFPLDCILGIKETKTLIVCPKSEGFVQTLSCRWHSLYLTSGAFVSPSADRILCWPLSGVWSSESNQTISARTRGEVGQSYPNPLGSACSEKSVIPFFFFERLSEKIKEPRAGGLSYNIINSSPGPRSENETLGNIKTHINGFGAKSVPLSTSWGQSWG